ncbi:MAG: hypothetical protein J6K14_07075 [Clostridia bacterium]|nr:hypothetical protein [Clostridia bacterium]
MSDTEIKEASHEIHINNREAFLAGGVLYVESFDDRSLSLKTVMGRMTVEGKKLKIEDFSKAEGKICISGEIDGFYYNEEPREKKKLFERFFQ